MMRLYHFVIIFAVFALGLLAVCETGIQQNVTSQENAIFYHEALERAVDAGAAVLKSSGDDIGAAADRACDAFMSCLSAYIGTNGMTPSVTELNKYIPVILVTDESGFYISSLEETAGISGDWEYKRVWSPHIPYAYDNGDYICIYSGRQTMHLFDRNRLRSQEGEIALIGLTEREAGQMNAEARLRQQVISEELVRYLEYYCSNHNRIAEQNGFGYSFFIPDCADAVLKAVDGTGFFALFQGYPMRGVNYEEYNLYSFAGCEVEEKDGYYINTSGEGLASARYYHSLNCAFRSSETEVYYSRRDCALHGAYACPECGGGYH